MRTVVRYFRFKSVGYGHLKKEAAFFSALLTVIELFIVLLSFLVSHQVFFGDLNMQPAAMLVCLFTIGVSYITYSIAGLYSTWRGTRFFDELRRLVLCWVVMVSAAGLFAFLTKTGEIVSRLWFGWSIIIAVVCLCLFRYALRVFLGWIRKRGFNFRSVVIVGAGEIGRTIAKRLNENRWIGLKVVAFFDDDESKQGEQILHANVVGDSSSLFDFIESNRKSGTPVDQVWITFPFRAEERIRYIINQLNDTSVDVRLVPNLFGLQLITGAVDQIGEIPLVNLSRVGNDGFSASLKNSLDWLFAACGLILLSPLLLLIAILIKLDSAGKVLFKQRRYGIDGQEIVVWKFRTMTVCDDGDSVVQARKGDHRITRLGGLLRRTSLDELPQLFNVLQGKMSLVGPRPHAVSHNEEYRKKISGYMKRHKIKPGITGWAQVNGWRGETDTLIKMEKRVELDIEYINNWSVWLDFKILFLTVLRGFTGKNVY